MKTYLPALLKVLRATCRYIRRWRDKILTHLPEGSDEALDAVLVACDVLEVIVELALPPSV